MANRLVVARHHLDTGNPQRALEVIAQLDAAELQGAESEAYEIAADAHLRLGDHEKALADAKRSLEHEPTNLDALRTVAWSSAGLGDHLTVSTTMSRALEIAPTNVTVLVDCAGLLTNEGRLSESAEFLLRAMALEPENPNVRVGLMEHAYASDDRHRARSLAHGILAEHPDHLRALAIDAAIAERDGDIRTAAQRMRRLASLRLGDKNARREELVKPSPGATLSFVRRGGSSGAGCAPGSFSSSWADLDGPHRGSRPMEPCRWWTVAVPVVPMLYLLACWSYTRVRQPRGRSVGQ